jgi:fatty-acyl-CoA synthase
MSSTPTATVRAMLETLNSNDMGMTFNCRSAPRFVCHGALGEQIRARGTAFPGMSCRHGDRIVLILPDEQQFIETFFGAIWAGAVPVPLFPPFLLAQLDNYLEHIKRVAAQCDSRMIVTTPEIVALLNQADSSMRCVSFADLEPNPASRLPRVRPNDIAFIQYTSGSTSTPRGVVVTHERLLANTIAFAEYMDIDAERDRGVTWLPLYHDMGLIGGAMMPLLKQGSVWYMQPLDFARNPTSWCDLINDMRGTLQFAPNFAYGLLTRRVSDEQLDGWDLSCWRIAGCGAEPIRPEVMRAFETRFARSGLRRTALLPCYGLAEATLAVTLSDPSTRWRSIRIDSECLRQEGRVVLAEESRATIEVVSCGRAIPAHEVRVADESGRALRDGMEGEVEVRGPCVMERYFADIAASRAALRSGWLHTGDLGFILDDELFITGRRSDLLIINGRNVHPQDIEWCAAEVAGVRQGNVVACGRPGRDGEEVVLVLEPSSAAEDIHALSARVASRVRAECRVPVADVVLLKKDTLPKTTSGKLRRKATREAYEQQRLSVFPEGGAR